MMSEETQPPPIRQLLPTIPEDIIVDILVRLPVQSLLQFRCVCKSWNSLTRSEKFIKLHLSRSVKDSSRRRVLLQLNPFWSVKYENVDDCGKDGFDDLIVKKDAPLVIANVHQNDSVYLIGEWNGLICYVITRRDRNMTGIRVVGSKNTYALWNASTGECREISKDDVANEIGRFSMFLNSAGRIIVYQSFGFGYDSMVDDYKIIRCMAYSPQPDVIYIEIFATGNRTWRKVEAQVSSPVRFRDSLCYLNGEFHWIAKKLDGGSTLLSFNLEREELKEVIPLPESRETSICKLDLKVLDGQLLLVQPLSEFYDIWVFNGHGAYELWTKKATLPMPVVPEPGLIYVESLVSPYRIPNIDGGDI